MAEKRFWDRHSRQNTVQSLASECQLLLAEIDALEASWTHPDNLLMPANLSDMKASLAQLHAVLGQNQDLIVRKLEVSGKKVALVFLNDMADERLLRSDILAPLQSHPPALTGSTSLLNVMQNTLHAPNLKGSKDFSKLVSSLLNGDSLILVEGHSQALIVSSSGVKERSPGTTSVENVLRGPQEAFTEKISYNLGLLRVRVKDPGLEIQYRMVGRGSLTKVAICSLPGRVDVDILKHVVSSVEAVATDYITDSGELLEYLHPGIFHIFPLAVSTERPDRAERALFDGRVVVIVDNSPFVLLLPSVYVDFFRSPEDYYIPWVPATGLRWLRLFADHLAALLPAIYVCIASFNPGALTPSFMLTLASSRTLVPYSPMLEILLVMVLGDLLVESSIRSPKVVGNAIPIVGGIVIGDVLVSTHLAGDVALVAGALATVANFTVTEPTMQQLMRIQKYWYLLWAAFLGFLGLMVGTTLQLAYMASLDSMGVAYFSPVAPFHLLEAINAKMVLPPRWWPDRASGSRKTQ